MKPIYRKAASILMIPGLFAAGLPAETPVLAFAENPKGTVTVTVYDDETGELADQNITFEILGTTEELARMGHVYGYGSWNITKTNPYTSDAFEIKPGWNYYVHLQGYNDSIYHYSINEEKSDINLDFDAAADQNLKVYISKEEKTGLLAYRGTFGEEQYPVFDYFHADQYGKLLQVHDYLICEDEFPEPLQYGDIFTTPPNMKTLACDTKYFRKFDPETQLVPSGSISDMEKITELTVAYIDYSVDEKPLTADMNYTVRMVLEDAAGNQYNYKTCEYMINAPYLLSGVKLGDTVMFTMLGKIPFMPVSKVSHVPDIMGDINEDRVFDLADIVLLSRWLLADPDVYVGDWMAADFNKDGRLDAADLQGIKKGLWDDRARPCCTLNILTTYDGYGVDGQHLGEGEFTQTFTIREGDWFYEDGRAQWVKNTLDKYRYNGKLLKVESLSETEIVVSCMAWDERGYNIEWRTIPLAYGDQQEIWSNIRVMDGMSFTHTISFADYYADGTYAALPEKTATPAES